jgi:tetratricopeptide (TPR) repeat protein
MARATGSIIHSTKNYIMKFICIAAMALFFYSCNRKAVITGQLPSTAADQPNTQLLGVHSKKDLQQVPFNEWFDKNYAAYSVDSFTAQQLAPLLKNKKLEIFMGTWCGDSKREVPRLFKVLDYIGVRPSQVTMIMVDNHDSTYKQSPTHEEQGKFIHRVPSLIVYDKNNELNRVVEYPVLSWEKDLLAISQGSPYQPNYRAAAYLLQVLKNKNTREVMADSTALAAALRPLVRSSAELNSLGYVCMAASDMDKALLTFELNALLFPADVNVYDSLGEINLKMNNKAAAKSYYTKVLALQPGNANAVKILNGLN